MQGSVGVGFWEFDWEGAPQVWEETLRSAADGRKLQHLQ